MRELKYIELLAQGLSVALAADLVGANYGTVCRHLREIGYDKHGQPVKRAKVTPRLTRLYVFVLKKCDTLAEAAELLHAPKEHVSRTISRLGLTKKWKLESNEDVTTSAGRKAELFVISLREKWLVRDCYKAKSGGKQSPYDLILKGKEDIVFGDGSAFTGGSVDVKHTALKSEHKRGYKEPTSRWLFSVGNFSKGVKWCALVAFDESKENIQAVWLVPGKLVYGHSTLRINNGASKYNQWLVWSHDSINLPVHGT